MKTINDFKYGKTHYERAMRGVQQMDELGGPDTLEEYVTIMTAVMNEVQARIATAQVRIEEGEK